MRTPLTPFLKLFPPGALQRAGISRIARVTELDRTGVEVASAVRPAGHVLQVSQGKGATFEAAALSAAHEAMELSAAENPDAGTFTWATARELGGVWSPLELPAAAATPLWHPDLPLPWVRAHRLEASGRVWVPAQAVFCTAEDAVDLGPLVTRWTSNGLGAHPTRQGALRHALLEVLERHALSLALPGGWVPARVKHRRVPNSTPLLRSLEARGFEVAAFDLTPQGTMLPPVAGALLRSRTTGAIGLTAGYACRPSLAEAVDSAVREAAQSRLTDIHGAREDVSHVDGGRTEDADPLFALVPGSTLTRRSTASVGAIAKASKLRLAWVDLSRPGARVHVVKVISPDAHLSELLS